ncbi:MAG: Gfo/Idh/MocA family oxidoreductase [Verrucomicrobiales bacterium]|nr:Gfo/Idh/MocA family oxidoreductase [Verrucomicrobiales bacterium]
MAIKSKLLSRTEWRRLYTFTRMYGWKRTMVKVAGHLRPRGMPWWLLGPAAVGERSVSVVGCGQHAFSALCFFILESRGNVFLECFDTELRQSESLAAFYGFRAVASSFEAMLDSSSLRTVYVVSNHASHTPYAVMALQRGLDVYVEKPLATSWSQWSFLRQALGESAGRVFSGCNRPYAPAVVALTGALAGRREPLSLKCRVRGHVLAPDHWYRRREEGSRICGNACHWIDLWVHCVHRRCQELPASVEVLLEPEDWGEADDNYRLTLRSPQRDRLDLHFTSKVDLLEGVWEMIECRCGDLRCEIDDFRSIRLSSPQGEIVTCYRPKDCGHRVASLQPFLPDSSLRAWSEVECSTELMLHIAEMTRLRTDVSRVNLDKPGCRAGSVRERSSCRHDAGRMPWPSS